MKNFNPVRGTEDVPPRASRIREWARQTILSTYQNNGYNLIDTPILENLEFLSGSDGGDNLHLIFKTIKRGDKLDLTKPNLCEDDITEEGLRYDLTVPLARFYSGNKEKLPTPFKSIQIGYSFRAERPQRGRNRQFIQCDLDVFGDASINAEVDLLKTVLETYSNLGFKDLTLKINSRKITNKLVLKAGFLQEQIKSVCVTLDKLDKIALNGVIMELIEKNFETQAINNLADAFAEITQKGTSALTKYGAEQADVEEIEFLINTLKQLTNNKFNIVFDASIIRGQGYYTGAVYEVFTTGFSGAIGGGGRYDNMVEKICGQSVPAVGFGLGFEPVCMLLNEQNQQGKIKPNLALVYENEPISEVYKVKSKLMQKFNVSLFKKPKNMKSFYEKIIAVAEFATSVADVVSGKEIKVL